MFCPTVCLSPRACYGLIRFATLSLMGICAVHPLSPPQTLCRFTLGPQQGKDIKGQTCSRTKQLKKNYYGLEK